MPAHPNLTASPFLFVLLRRPRLHVVPLPSSSTASPTVGAAARGPPGADVPLQLPGLRAGAACFFRGGEALVRC